MHSTASFLVAQLTRDAHILISSIQERKEGEARSIDSPVWLVGTGGLADVGAWTGPP